MSDFGKNDRVLPPTKPLFRPESRSDIRLLGTPNREIREIVASNITYTARARAAHLSKGTPEFDSLTDEVIEIDNNIYAKWSVLRKELSNARSAFRQDDSEGARLEVVAAAEALADFEDQNPEVKRVNFKSIAEHLIKLRTLELDTVSKIRAGKLDLVDGVLVDVPTILSDARRQEVMTEYVANSANQKKLNSYYQMLGMAQMITLGDWSVDRLDEVSDALGVASMAEVERLLLNFHVEMGTIQGPQPILDGKLVHLHLGPGNGVLMERLRRDATVDPLDNGTKLNDYFQELGFGDRIYFTLNDLLKGFVRDDLSSPEAEVIDEFIKVISTLLLRRIHYGRKFKSSLSNKDLLPLPKNINMLRGILLSLNEYIGRLYNKTEIKGDGEFLSDKVIVISEGCQALLNQYFRGSSALVDTDGESYGVESFLNRYFKPELMDPKVDLSQHITMWGQNVILRRFEDFGTVFPQAPTFDLIHSVRGTSHLDDQEFINVVYEASQRMKPGAIYLDDGIRESYTRFIRTKVEGGKLNGLEELAARLGESYRVRLIITDTQVKSLIIERAIETEDESNIFMTDRIDNNKFFLAGTTVLPVGEFSRKFPEIAFRNKIINRLKSVFIRAGIEDPSDIEKTAFVRNFGRSRFKGVHDKIDLELDSVFKSGKWLSISQADAENPIVIDYIEEVWSRILQVIPEVQKQDEIVRRGIVPINKQAIVTTYPMKNIPTADRVNSKVDWPVGELPRNEDVVPLNRLQDKIAALKKTLNVLLSCGVSKYGDGYRPIVVLESQSFTNRLTRKFLLEIFGREDLDKFVRFQKIVIGEAESYPKQQDGVIYYVAGSESDVYTDQGDDFVRNFIIPLLKSINDGGPNRAIGSCFGHQAFLSAFGMAGYGGSGYHPRAGAFQFGAFPVKFEGDSNTSATNYLRGRDLVVPFTRSGYVVAPSHRYDSNIKGLAYEPRNTETPVVTSMFNGKVITTQPHPEISLTSSSDIKAVLRYLHRRYDQLVEVFNFSGSESVEQFLKTLKTNFQIEGRNKTGRKVPWIKEGGDFGYSLVVPALLEQAESLGKQLSLND